MKLTILLLFLSSVCFAQTQVGTNQLKDGSVTQSKLGAGSVSTAKIATGAVTSEKIATSAVTVEKLAGSALRPINKGTLSNYELTFDDVQKQYNLSVTSDISLTLAASGNNANSHIYITATGDGIHSVNFPSDWKIKSGSVYNTNAIQEIHLRYTGSYVVVEIGVFEEIVTVQLISAAVQESTLDQLNLSFSSEVLIDATGWTLSASEGALLIESVTGDGTSTPVFQLSRDVILGETVTLSYDGDTGGTTSSTGNEIDDITNEPVSIPPAVAACDCDIYSDDDAADDIAAGTTGDPFKSIGAASNAATTGQAVCVKAGTYRETVTGKSGVTYRALCGETVIISGLNTADGGWTVHSSDIYKKTITINGGNIYNNNWGSDNTTLAAIQVFDEGEMMIQSRWPKADNTTELLDRANLRQKNQVTSGGGSWPDGSINDPGMLAIDWTGGQIWLTGWYISRTGTITSDGGNTINYSGANTGDQRFRQYYYLTGKLAALTQANEWHYESGILYVWQAGGGSPTGIEYKARNWGFDLRDKTGVTIEGFHFVGCEPMTGNVNSHNITLDEIRARYTNHTFLLTGGSDLYTNARKSGMMLIGDNCVIKNSEIEFFSSQGIWLGESGLVENNLIEKGNYEGNYGAAVNFWVPNSGGQKVLRNTMDYFGRSAIDFSEFEGRYGVGVQTHLNMEIAYNDISGSLSLSADGGQTYGSVYTNLTGTVLHHNWIHDSRATQTPTAADVVGIAAGIYWDQASGPTTAHHNVLWNNYQCDFHVQQNGLPKRHAGKGWLYNNTFATSNGTSHGFVSYLTTTTDVEDVMRNNIFRDEAFINFVQIPNNGSPGDAENCLFHTTDPLFVGSGTGGLAYRLTTSSPGKNTGVVVTGVTDGAVGVPDIGAYEFDATDEYAAWVPGYDASLGGGGGGTPASGDIDATTATVTYSSSPVWDLPMGSPASGWFGSTISYSDTPSSTATFSCESCTGIKLYAERLSSHGTGTATFTCHSGHSSYSATLDFNDTPHGFQQLIWDSGTLTEANHTAVITVTSGYCLVDYFNVTP